MDTPLLFLFFRVHHFFDNERSNASITFLPVFFPTCCRIRRGLRCSACFIWRSAHFSEINSGSV